MIKREKAPAGFTFLNEPNLLLALQIETLIFKLHHPPKQDFYSLPFMSSPAGATELLVTDY